MTSRRDYYVHRPLGETIQAIGGSYRLVREGLLSWGSSEVLYLVGHALFDSSCCGVGGCGYAVVQGVVRRLRDRTSADGLPLSEVELVVDEADRQRLTTLLVERERVQQVRFRSP